MEILPDFIKKYSEKPLVLLIVRYEQLLVYTVEYANNKSLYHHYHHVEVVLSYIFVSRAISCACS